MQISVYAYAAIHYIIELSAEVTSGLVFSDSKSDFFAWKLAILDLFSLRSFGIELIHFIWINFDVSKKIDCTKFSVITLKEAYGVLQAHTFNYMITWIHSICQ